MFKKLKELLEAGKIDKEVADALDGEIATALKEKNDEAAKWRVKYNDLNKNFESVSQAKEDLEGKLANFDTEIQKAKDEGKSELVKELEAQKSQMQELQNNLSAIQEQNRALKIETALNGGLGKYDVVDADLVGTYIKGLVELDGENLKYKDGENSLSLEDGLKKFFEDKPHLLKAQGNGGSGANGGVNSGGTLKRSQMSDDDADAYIAKYGAEAYMQLQE